MMADLVETMHHAEMLWRSERRRICHQLLCLPDNNRTQYFVPRACPMVYRFDKGWSGRCRGDGDRRSLTSLVSKLVILEIMP